jgi:hypothetical protein
MHTTQTSMPLVGFEPTVPAFERAKTVHALHRTTTILGSECIDPGALNVGISWMWVVNFTLRRLYLRGNNPWYPLDRGRVGPRTGLDDVEREKSCPYRDRLLVRLALSQSLYQLRCPTFRLVLDVSEDRSMRNESCTLVAFHRKSSRRTRQRLASFIFSIYYLH